MVRYFHGESGSEGIIGQQTGLLVCSKLHLCRQKQLALPGVQSEAASGRVQVATASAAQAISAFCWGLMSDRIGRKVWTPALVTCHGRSAAKLSVLPCSLSYWWATCLLASASWRWACRQTLPLLLSADSLAAC